MATRYKRSSRGILAAALTAFSVGALAGEITLFHNRDLGGDRITLNSPASTLKGSGFLDSSSAIVHSGTWEVCTEANFTGRCTRLQPGEYRNLTTLLNDDIASAREIVAGAYLAPTTIVAGGSPVWSAPAYVATVPGPVVVAPPAPPVFVATLDPRIVLYRDRSFGGSSLELTKTMGGLDRSGQYSGANAAVVYGGVWRLCSQEYFRGECADFAPGQYADLGTMTGHVASAELVAVTTTQR